MWQYNNLDELYHYGVLGMRWGRRKARKSTLSDDHLKTQKIKKKRISELSNKELQEYNNRKNLERNYNSFKPIHFAMGMAAFGAAAVIIGNYKNIKSNLPELLQDGKILVSKMRNIRIPRLK